MVAISCSSPHLFSTFSVSSHCSFLRKIRWPIMQVHKFCKSCCLAGNVCMRSLLLISNGVCWWHGSARPCASSFGIFFCGVVVMQPVAGMHSFNYMVLNMHLVCTVPFVTCAVTSLLPRRQIFSIRFFWFASAMYCSQQKEDED